MAAEFLHDIQCIVNHVFHEIAVKYHNIYRTLWWRILGINTSSWLISFYDESFSYFKLPKVLNIFSNTSLGVFPPPTISARRKRHLRTNWFAKSSKRRMECSSSCIGWKSIYYLKFFSKEKRVHLPALGMKFINPYIHIWALLNL